jgi:hypothetical protein
MKIIDVELNQTAQNSSADLYLKQNTNKWIILL